MNTTSPNVSGKRIRFEETPIVVPTGNIAMSAAKAAYASGLLTLHSSLRLDEEQSKLFDTFIKKYKKLHDKRSSINKFEDDTYVPHSIRIIIPELKSSNSIASSERFKAMVTEFNTSLTTFKEKGTALFKEAAEMEIQELQRSLISDFQIYLKKVVEVNFLLTEASRDPQNVATTTFAILSKNANSIQSDQIATGLLKLRITTEISDSTSIAAFVEAWSGTTHQPVTNAYANPKSKAFVLNCKNNIACTYLAALNAFDTLLERKEQETKLTKHLTSLRVKEAADDTVMASSELPAVQNEKQLKLLVTNLIQENFVKQTKKNKNNDAKNKKEGQKSASLKKKKKSPASRANSADASVNATSVDSGRSMTNTNQRLNHGPTGGRGRGRTNGRGRGRGRNQDTNGGRGGRGRGRH